MPIIFTTITRVKDWQKLREIYHAALLSRAQPAGAKGVQVWRDLHDSSQALLIAELPDQDAVCDWRMALEEHLVPALGEVQLDARAWEATGWVTASEPDPPLSQPSGTRPHPRLGGFPP